MNQPKYLCRSGKSLFVFKFTSKGSKGLVEKIIEYTATDSDNIYNLGFGDYDPLTDSMNDLTITDNGDSSKVLATVASTVYTFTDENPSAMILFTGSTPARTRLYRMAITINLAEISQDFVIFGYSSDRNWEEFVVNKSYHAFLVTKRENEYTL
jgi:predicted choloylglycine hydrolase